jgi:hypothetical protein
LHRRLLQSRSLRPQLEANLLDVNMTTAPKLKAAPEPAALPSSAMEIA